MDGEHVYVRHIDGSTLVRWKFTDLERQFKRKISSLILVYAKTEIRGDDEYFHFYKAEYLKEPDHSLIANEIKNETILIDLRLHDKGTMARNHGTGFRLYERDLPKVFRYGEVL